MTRRYRINNRALKIDGAIEQQNVLFASLVAVMLPHFCAYDSEYINDTKSIS
ncbi:MAG: hypothetical protein ACJ72V_18260 [Nitrososphaeraceae archaeon]